MATGRVQSMHRTTCDPIWKSWDPNKTSFWLPQCRPSRIPASQHSHHASIHTPTYVFTASCNYLDQILWPSTQQAPMYKKKLAPAPGVALGRLPPQP